MDRSESLKTKIVAYSSVLISAIEEHWENEGQPSRRLKKYSNLFIKELEKKSDRACKDIEGAKSFDSFIRIVDYLDQFDSDQIDEISKQLIQQ